LNSCLQILTKYCAGRFGTVKVEKARQSTANFLSGIIKEGMTYKFQIYAYK